jgi:hypothetical protein
VAAPSWYHSDRPFTLSTYLRDVQRFGREMREALAAGRRGGGSFGGGGSGFSGGSSGGGRGGGGGGTF